MTIGEMDFGCRNLTIFQKNEQIIEDVNITLTSGHVLAVIGHEVCGKTKLLSTLAGRHPLYQGSIFINGEEQVYHALSRRVAYVTSQPLFLPTLTVRETIEYAGYLRMDTSFNQDEKMDRIRAIEKLTGLSDFADTPVQWCSKFQQKCLALACELLLSANILVADDLFNGLSCNDCHKMTSLLTKLCREINICVVISLSSPISSIISVCACVLFLNHGKVVYNGTLEALPEYLSNAGCPPPAFLSTTEHLMTLLSSNMDDVNVSGSVTNKLMKNGQYISATDDIWLKDSIPVSYSKYKGNGCGNSHEVNETVKVEVERQAFLTTEDNYSTSCRTSYWNQVKVLTSRNFHNARRRLLFPVSVIQNIYILVICVLIWWRPDRSEETIKDRMGLFFFTIVQWAFFALLDAILTFPKEMRVILAEKRDRLYDTSAFCISKTISEIPLAILQPCVYMCVIYWVANLNSASAFIASLGVLVIDVLVAQSIGLFVGAALNPPWTISVVSLGLLSMMLWGGAFCTPPPWLTWGKFASYFTYGLDALITLEFQYAEPIKCGTSSMIPICNTTSPITNQTITHFPAEFVLLAQNITWSVFDDVAVLLGIGFTARVLWYIVLRRK